MYTAKICSQYNVYRQVHSLYDQIPLLIKWLFIRQHLLINLTNLESNHYVNIVHDVIRDKWAKAQSAFYSLGSNPTWTDNKSRKFVSRLANGWWFSLGILGSTSFFEKTVSIKVNNSRLGCISPLLNSTSTYHNSNVHGRLFTCNTLFGTLI